MLLGCIADDFTGATDLANTLTRQGMRTGVLLGVPDAGMPTPDVDAVVVALKSRSNPVDEAVSQSLSALAWLQSAGARQFYFKYCSTFDSTDAGNIGPVAEALMSSLGVDFTIACPAFPTNKRTIYNGHLFVDGQLLSESGMRHHPLTPMTDALLTRVLQRQCQGKVGLIPYDVVARGVGAIRRCIAQLIKDGIRIAIADAINDQHLLDLGTACAQIKLITGGSGMALGLPENFQRAGLLAKHNAASLPQVGGHAVVLAGSCSVATNRQVTVFKEKFEFLALSMDALADGANVAATALAWARPRLGDQPLLIHSTADADSVSRTQALLGRERAGALIEQTMAHIAQGLVSMGVKRLVVAGGETSGAVVSALNVRGLRVGAEIDPGVPWTVSIGEDPIALALKSGNFGADDFFEKALRVQS
jgi:uncharacterized protein YgbK (DUF1537 family)